MLKYRNQRTSAHGRSFASRLEAELYGQLLLRQYAGEICGLRCQPNVFLTLPKTQAKIRVIPDFCAEENGRIIYFEAKGFEAERWKWIKLLWPELGPAPLWVYRGSHKKLYLAEKLIPVSD